MKPSFKMTLDDAKAIAAAAAVEAKKINVAMTVAIVDAGGLPIYLEKPDGASALSGDIALRKAHSAALVRVATSQLEAIGKQHPAILLLPGFTAIGGGLPITYQGEVVGAIGASGGMADQDEQVAAAGIKALG